MVIDIILFLFTNVEYRNNTLIKVRIDSFYPSVFLYILLETAAYYINFSLCYCKVLSAICQVMSSIPRCWKTCLINVEQVFPLKGKRWQLYIIIITEIFYNIDGQQREYLGNVFLLNDVLNSNGMEKTPKNICTWTILCINSICLLLESWKNNLVYDKKFILTDV